METCIVSSPLGFTKIVGDEDGIRQITVLDSQETPTDIIPEELEDCARQLAEYFDGSRQYFDLQLNPEGSDFQKEIWDLLLEIPYGKTCSYLELSKKYGDPKAIRAVAGANGKNPLWIVIPCHRVIGSKGELTGYAGGIHRKKWLLEHESPFKQQSLF